MNGGWIVVWCPCYVEIKLSATWHFGMAVQKVFLRPQISSRNEDEASVSFIADQTKHWGCSQSTATKFVTLELIWICSNFSDEIYFNSNFTPREWYLLGILFKNVSTIHPCLTTAFHNIMEICAQYILLDLYAAVSDQEHSEA